MNHSPKGSKSNDLDRMEKIRLAFIQNNGSLAKTAQEFDLARPTVLAMRDRYGWAKDLKKVKAAIQANNDRTVVEANTIALCALDEYIDAQLDYIQAGMIRRPDKTLEGFDPQGLSEAIKSRNLLTGAATERLALDMNAFFAEWRKIDPGKRRELLARIRSRRSAG